MHDTEDKLWWCEHGQKHELNFVALLARFHNKRAEINPEKQRNKYAPDLLVEGCLADLKVRTTPFFTADRYGLDPQYAVTFNRKDAERYREKYPRLHIYFWLNWRETEFGGIVVRPMVWIAGVTFPRLSDLLSNAPEHTYQRRAGDAKGNGKSSFLLDVRSFKKIYP